MKQCCAKVVTFVDLPARQCANFGPTTWISSTVRGRLPYNITVNLCPEHLVELRAKTEDFFVAEEKREKAR